MPVGDDMTQPPYLTYASYLQERHGCTVYRVAVDAGFSCPNRPEGRSSRGCTYCAEEGGRAPYLSAAAITRSINSRDGNGRTPSWINTSSDCGEQESSPAKAVEQAVLAVNPSAAFRLEGDST
jgi:hypothetical protein